MRKAAHFQPLKQKKAVYPAKQQQRRCWSRVLPAPSPDHPRVPQPSSCIPQVFECFEQASPSFFVSYRLKKKKSSRSEPASCKARQGHRSVFSVYSRA